MRIDISSAVTPSSEAQTKAQPGGRAAAPPQGSAAAAGDQTRLSLDQGRIQTLAAQASGVPEIRQEKVAALARLVSGGQYRVSAQQTAEAIVSQLRSTA